MKRILCTLSLLLALFLFFGTVSVSAENLSIPEVISKMKLENSKISDMKCVFVKKIYKNGKIIPETSMTFKYLKSPETLFVEFINRKKGQKCLYVRGQNDDMLIVRPPGFWKIITVKVDPAGEKAMEESLSPMTGMDFGSVIANFEKLYTAVSTNDKVIKEYTENIQHRGKTLHMLKIESDKKDNGYFYMYIDPSTFLPYEISYETAGNNAIYTYKNLEINPNLDDDEFKV